MYLDNLDELDQKIIQLLIENARISYSGDLCEYDLLSSVSDGEVCGGDSPLRRGQTLKRKCIMSPSWAT